MKVFIIHRSARTDRIANIARLLATFPKAQIFDAVVPAWETDPHSVAVRGCAASHLGAARRGMGAEPTLVLEDDAVVIPEHLEEFSKLDLTTLPGDCAALLLGADVLHYGSAQRQGLREVIPPYFGSHAVLYLPGKLEFLLEAYDLAASRKLGASAQGICLESLLQLAARGVGQKLYRPERLCFTTQADRSDTRGVVTPARDLALVARDKDPLLPLSTWADVFEPHRGKKGFLIPIAGNHGDALINEATRGLFAHYGVQEVTAREDADVLFHPGGGNASAQYPQILDPEFEASSALKVVLPQTLHQKTAYVESADVVWVRDQESLRHTSKGRFAPDLALAYRNPLVNLPKPTRDIGVFFRADAERTLIPTDNQGDPTTYGSSHYDYLALAATYTRIHTNRLHFGIAGLLVGSDVTLYANSYHKNQSVFSSLAPLGVKWGELKQAPSSKT